MIGAIGGTMPRRHPCPSLLPHRWLMTDERLGDGLWPAIHALPPGSGIVFRHYATPPDARQRLFIRVQRLARRRRLLLVIAGPPIAGSSRLPRHGRTSGALTAPVHSRREAIAAQRAGAALLFVSPVHPTRSHPGAPALGRVRFALMIRGLSVPVVALGGMNARRWRALRPLAVHGWAAIDAWRTD
ncbi:thiamine-phosphate pyrophosphorylase [Sphingomonas sp. BE123]|uniref:thiamine phosphate synthase n=1 Tax=Sphingomonas sp. BE123 TaxID=2817842 RepID=UPI002855A71E|nr:thiamine phosphate synthase [Sphingomonas sp. BE123]MDR6852400.1 thiamine-phosphate pyrophosphorylase [Sphingomonas sp. BE123]